MQRILKGKSDADKQLICKSLFSAVKTKIYSVMFDIVVKNKSNVVKRGVHSYRQRYASSQWSKFIADSLGCAS